jgi:hypothetical protein
MKTRFAALVLVSLGLAACDPDSASPQPTIEDVATDAPVFRDGECITVQTQTIGLSYKNGGYFPDWPDWVGQTYNEAPGEWRAAFDDELLSQAETMVKVVFEADDKALEGCADVCREADLTWTEGSCVTSLALSHDDASAEHAYQENLRWTTNVDVIAEVGCGCI